MLYIYAFAQNVTLAFFSYLFWTEWGILPRLSRCSLDGKRETRTTLIHQEIVWPNALTIDYSSNTLWWADAKLKKIESCDLNGSNRKLVMSVDAGHPFSIAVNSKYVFWTNWKTKTLDKIEKNSVYRYPTRTSSFKSHPLGVVTIYAGKHKAGISFVTRSVQSPNRYCLHVIPFAMHRNIHKWISRTMFWMRWTITQTWLFTMAAMQIWKLICKLAHKRESPCRSAIPGHVPLTFYCIYLSFSLHCMLSRQWRLQSSMPVIQSKKSLLVRVSCENATRSGSKNLSATL